MGAKYTTGTYTCENCGKVYKDAYNAKRKFCCRQCGTEYAVKQRVCTCLTCGKIFTKYPASKGLYCSRECYDFSKRGKHPHNYSGGPVEVKCVICGSTFTVDKHRVTTAKTCSYACSGKLRATNEKRTCVHCGKEFKIWKPRKNSARFCSRKCQGEHYRGDNSPCWKGGRFPYYGKSWNDQRKAARKRDGYRCQHCGITQKKLGRQLDVHHIVPRSEFNGDEAKANALSNLISLCKSCHRKAETGKIPIQPTLV